MKECIFCRLVSGEVAPYKVYEDEQVMAFLTNQPIREGHTLVVPKAHVDHFTEIAEEDYLAVMLAVKKIAEKMKVVLSPKRVGVMIAGWDVPHAHVHVVPMEETTDVASKVQLDETYAYASPPHYESVAEKIRV